MKRRLAYVFCYALTCLSLSSYQPSIVHAAQPGNQTSQVSATIEPIEFNATVPTNIPITIKADGSVLTADKLDITTTAGTPVEVKNISITKKDDWSLTSYNNGNTSEVASKPVDSKLLGLRFSHNETNFDTDGSVSQEFNTASQGLDIYKSKPLELTYKGISGITTETGDIGSKFDVVFTIGWSGFEGPTKAELIKSISVKQQPDKLDYKVGENFDSTGLKLTVTYQDEHTEELSEGFEITNGNNLQQGTQNITITFKNKDSQASCTVEVNVTPNYTYQLSKSKFNSVVPKATATKIVFTNRAQGSSPQSVSDDGSVLAASEGTTYYVYTPDNSKVKAPKDSSRLFNGYSLLNNLDVSYLDTSSVTNMQEMFYECEKLQNITGLGGFNTSNVTEMGYMFEGCVLLEEVDVSKFNTSNVTDMTQMFSRCKSLRSINVSSFNTSKVDNMSNMFNNCILLTDLDLSKFDTSSVVNFENMFNNCEKLVNLKVSNFKTDKSTSMMGMFRLCKALVTLDLYGFNFENVSDVNGIFQECNKLKTVYVKDSTAKSKLDSSSSKPSGCNITIKG